MNCGCAGLPAAPRLSLDAPEAAREPTVPLAAVIYSGKLPASPAGRAPDPRHQRPPPG
jgi:hypothetical protein